MIKDALKYLEPNACVPIDMATTIMLVNALKEALAHRIEQEPVALPCCGYTNASVVKWNPFNRIVQCHNCGQTYTPQQMTPWSQKTIEQKIEASIRHYKKEIERAKEVGDPHQFVGTYEGFVVCLESILEKNT
jgi:transposase-like protein